MLLLGVRFRSPRWHDIQLQARQPGKAAAANRREAAPFSRDVHVKAAAPPVPPYLADRSSRERLRETNTLWRITATAIHRRRSLEAVKIQSLVNSWSSRRQGARGKLASWYQHGISAGIQACQRSVQ
jgi:hypothetical protein